MQRPERGSYTPLDFLEWREGGTLLLTPKFQRRSVWSTSAKAYLMDTLLSGMPVPPIYLRVRQSDTRKKILREVVDGQQRITAVLEFMDGAYRLPKAFGHGRGGKSFAQLAQEEQDAIRTYSFNCEVFQGIGDSEVLAIFARLNTYSIQLNAQELRNGQYFGAFKQLAYRLAYEYVEFWRTHGVLTERAIARMHDAELVSELLVASAVGMQDKKASLDKFYEDWDEAIPHEKRVEQRYRTVLDVIGTGLGEVLKDSSFRKPPMFYSLFCCVYARQYGLPTESLRHTGTAITGAELAGLRDAVVALSDIVARAKSGEDMPGSMGRFATACLRQTDNIKPRQTRLRALYKRAFD